MGVRRGTVILVSRVCVGTFSILGSAYWGGFVNQRAEVWAERLLRSRVDMSHSWISAESWRQEFIALRALRLATLHLLGDLPLIVLRRGQRTTDVLIQREAALVELSSIGKLVVAAESDHLIQLYQPELVAQAIQDVVGQARLVHRH